MIERIKLIIDNENVSVRRFEQSIGASDGLIRRAIANNTDIQSKWLAKIAENYPNYSRDWLLTGEGAMIRANNEEKQKSEGGNLEFMTEIIKLQRENIEKSNTIIEQTAMIAELRRQLDSLSGGDVAGNKIA